jgi:hypothetical protein
MAVNATMGGNGTLFVGEDKIFKLFPVLDVNGVPVDMTLWAIIFDVRQKDTSPDPALLSKSAVILGAYNVDPLLNTQYAQVVVTSNDMNQFKEKTYRQSWKRTDTGFETDLEWGNFTPQKATAP